MSAPLATVLAAVEQGETTRAGIAGRTGLDPVVVDAAVDHLVRIGLVAVPSLRTGCPSAGCSQCVVDGCSAGPVSR